MAKQIIVDGKVYSVTNTGIGFTGRTEENFYNVNPQLRGHLPTYSAQEADKIWGGILSNAGKNDAFGNDITGQTIHKDKLGSGFDAAIQSTLAGISSPMNTANIPTPNVPRLGTAPDGTAVPTERSRGGQTIFTSDPYTLKTTGSLTSQPTQPSTSAFTLTQGNLQEGVKNQNVTELQTLLNKYSNAGLTVDGDYGPKTKAVVMAFQKANGLTPDGVVGPQTTAALAKLGQPITSSGGKSPVDLVQDIQNQGGVLGSSQGSVGTSGSARKKAAEIEAMRAALGVEAPPAAPDLFSAGQEKELKIARNDRDAINERLTEIQNLKLQADEELQRYKVKSGREISQQGFLGNVSEQERSISERLMPLLREEMVLNTKLHNRNTVISELMGLQQQDWQNANQAYDRAFSQQKLLYDMVEDDKDELVREAKANLDVLSSMFAAQIDAGQLSPLSISPQQKLKLEQLEAQARLPLGSTLAILQTLKPGEQEIHKSFDENTGNLYITTKDASGKISTKVIKGGAPNNPGGVPGTTGGELAKTYTIKGGDTFFNIAQSKGYTVEAMRAANPGVDENNLRPGQVVRLPTSLSTTKLGGSGGDDFDSLDYENK